jgi:antitoxin component of RelBE/YafQ-DinJ toxin-antitoxin module
MKDNRFKRRSINLDDATHEKCKALADDLGLSVSGFLRIMIRQAYEQQPTFFTRKQDADVS